jgi:hypothetical protein
MAIIAECDLCHKRIADGEITSMGYAIPREYCKCCAPKMERMQRKIDDLHTRLAAEWEKELAAIRASYSEEGGLLPDVEA